MFSYILSFEILIFSVIIADPDLPPSNSDFYKPQPPPSSYNYYGYRQPQIQTPSPYLNKRNPDGNTYSSSVASSQGYVPTRSAANQCKLHINCPSKKTKKKIRCVFQRL